jgi:ketosteroid isomerase-like protein
VKRFLLRLGLTLACCVPSLLAQQAPPQAGGPRIVTMTRPMAVFSELENRLVAAAQKKDRAALQGLISEDCNLWTPAPPGDPMPSEDWIASLLKDPASSFAMRQLAVQTFGDTSVVSFVASEGRRVKGKQQTARHFVVDVWTKKGDAWQLSARYLSPATGVTYAPARPSGKH